MVEIRRKLEQITAWSVKCIKCSQEKKIPKGKYTGINAKTRQGEGWLAWITPRSCLSNYLEKKYATGTGNKIKTGDGHCNTPELLM